MFFSASSVKEYFSEIKTPYDSKFLIGQFLSREGSRDITLSLTEIRQEHPTRTLETHNVANWT
jgi:hypothetical protein